MRKNDREKLVKFVRAQIGKGTTSPVALVNLTRIEAKKRNIPHDENSISFIVMEGVDAGALMPPKVCSSARDVNLDEACEPLFFIPQLLAEGVTFLNSPPKGGKSRLFMQMAIALCRGDKFMGRQCDMVSVLYLALEDEREDFESRLRLFMQGNDAPENLYFATLEDFDYNPPTLEGDAIIDLINENIKTYPGIKVVLIDVFGAIRSKKQKGDDFMDVERRDIQSLIRLSAHNKIAVVVAHHVSHTKRKGPIETIGSGAGSYVVSATVHAEMLLYKNEQTDAFTFSVQGRRIPLQKFAVEDDFPRWRFCGSNDEYEVANNPLIITIKHIVENCQEGEKWCGSGSEIVEYAKKNGLKTIPQNINKNTFTPQFIHQLSIVRVRYQQIKNGTGAVKHQFSKM